MEDIMSQKIECKEIEELFVDFISGNLSMDKIMSIRNHIESCKECEQFMKNGIEILQDNDTNEYTEDDFSSESTNDPQSFFNKLKAKTIMRKEINVFENIHDMIRNFTEDALSAIVNIKWQLIPVHQLAPVTVRLKNDPKNELKINCVRFNKTINEIHLEIFAEHLDTEEFNLDIFVRNETLPKAVRFFLIDPNNKQSSKQLVSKDPVSFEHLKYGDYKIVVMQKGTEKGMLWLDINKSGVYER